MIRWADNVAGMRVWKIYTKYWSKT